MTLGQNICRLRTERGLSQGDLADALDVSRQSISKWETDASVPELEKLRRLSELFHISLDALVGGEAAPEPPKPRAPLPETLFLAPLDPQQARRLRKAGLILLGIGLAVLSLLTWALYLIITRRVSQRYTAVTQMKWTFLISAVAVLPMAWGELGSQPLYSSACTWTGAAEMAFIVVFATVAGYFAIPFAMRYIKATTVSVYTNLQPIVASFVAIAIGQDVITWDKPVALVLVLLSAYMVTRADSRS